eukprot:m.187015 g.187015  ORF g.187015 m.187015 type:complete len:132 (+) comp18495_c0_seq20:474-869(+)
MEFSPLHLRSTSKEQLAMEGSTKHSMWEKKTACGGGGALRSQLVPGPRDTTTTMVFMLHDRHEASTSNNMHALCQTRRQRLSVDTACVTLVRLATNGVLEKATEHKERTRYKTTLILCFCYLLRVAFSSIE